MSNPLMRGISGFLLVCLSAFAQENKYTLIGLPQNLTLAGPNKDTWFDYNNAVLQQDHVLDLIAATTGRCAPAPSKDSGADHTANLSKCDDKTKWLFPSKDDYIIFHVVNWGGSNSSGLKATKQNWYVFNTANDWDYTAFSGVRIFGKKPSIYTPSS